MSGDGQLDVGDVIDGRYRVDGVFGQGGFGVVLKGTQLSIDRPVAIKVLQPDLLSDERAVQRFIREARFCQRLDHPNTVKLLEVVLKPDGTPYIVFEYLMGRGLDVLLTEDGPLPPERVARIAGYVLKSLMDAHERGIVHRDIKPGNIFICPVAGEPDFTKVLDFGIAKGLDGSSLAFRTLTQAGSIFGTPSYMAPECLRGEGATPQADLYALGLVMAEMLTGEVVVTGKSLVAICAAHFDEGPHELSEAVSTSPIGAVIRRAVEKEAARRYQGASEMLADLEVALVSPQAARPRPSSTLSTMLEAPELRTRPLPASRRNFVWFAVIGAVVLLGATSGVIVGATAWLRHDREASPESTPSALNLGENEGVLAELTADQIRRRIEQAGWYVNSSILTSHGDFELRQISVIRLGDGGVVNIYRFSNHQMIESAERENRAVTTAAVHREGHHLLVVSMSDRTASETVLASILRGSE